LSQTTKAEEKPESGLRYLLRGSVLGRSLLIALAVGCLLSAANQYDVILRGPRDGRLGLKIVMNFLIPFVVASLSAVVNRPRR